MKILVTGATGFTGSHAVSVCLDRGHSVVCFVRKSGDFSALPEGRVRLAVGDLAVPETLEEVLRGQDALLNFASLGFGHAAGIVAAAERAGVPRAVFISTTAVFTSLPAASKSVRLAAEEAIRGSRLAWTILRPTMIYGTARDRNISRLVRFLRRSPLVPLPGRRDARQQPVHVEDVALAAVLALEARATAGRAYNIGGAEPLTLEQIVDTICARLNRRPVKIRVPSGPIVAVTRLLEGFGLHLPIRSEQLLRLDEDKAFDWSEAAGDFGYNPRRFVDGVEHLTAIEPT